MGAILTLGYNRYMYPDLYPEPDTIPKSDPLYGFPEGRQEKVMVATEDEMYSAKVPLPLRDYCAHMYIDFLKCRKENFPFVAKCHHEKHAYHNCEYGEYIDRMKDYERERRLMVRAKRIAANANAA
ncbi:NADH dehydrogenase [ubiquinone] 1 beta subcomplex subunit 7 [Homalodisca vitripennis]|uniref:NADH dehydrogenase [ubiquinone] 1 beta subcomplex subunit 7 n=1 Tax=Homalodisca vitripennis TaxID=197043 RepID=UPI001EEA2D2E|nr:NADH dehydrogenase [ubiquinone] 1 beta subcomplex subunit 7 [Homalodisca vitripennis]